MRLRWSIRRSPASAWPARAVRCRPFLVRPRSAPGFGSLSIRGVLLTLVSAALAWAQPSLGAAQSGALSIPMDGEETTIVADQIQQVGGTTDLLIAIGNVEIIRGQTRLLADRVELNRDTGQAVAQGKVVFSDGPDRMVADRVDYNLKTGTGVAYNGAMAAPPYYHLTGEQIDRVGDSIYNVRRGTFTTCEDDNPPWSFHFGSGTADLEESLTGRDVSLWVKSIPVLPWVPFFVAPLRRERQSGFLFPIYGTSSRKGYFAEIPYFWAINDSQDLTLKLDTFSKKGVGLDAEYRYVLSREQNGALSAFGVNESFRNQRQSIATPENRGWLSARHDWQITPSLTFKADSNITTDNQVYRDYALSLNDRARQAAITNVSLTQRWSTWSLVGRAMYYQDLTTKDPIELYRLPEITLQGVRQPVPGVPGLLYETQASLTNFVRTDGPEGLRGDLHPRMFYPIPVAGFLTITPFLGGRLTYYQQRLTTETGATPTGIQFQESVNDPQARGLIEWGAEVQSRMSKVYTMDGDYGLAALQHVIVPRAVFTEIRGLDTWRTIPVFDPGASTASGIDPGYLARQGPDAVGRANEVTYYLENIVNAKTVSGVDQQAVRWELMKFTLSQTYSFEPVRWPVGFTFPNEPVHEQVGPLFGNLNIQPSQRILFHADAKYDMHGLGFHQINANVGVVYPDFTFGVGPRFNEATSPALRTVTAQATARIWRNLILRADTAWDLQRGVDVQTSAGLEWRFDCWAIMTQYITRLQGGNEFRFTVNLLGVGETGTSTKTP